MRRYIALLTAFFIAGVLFSACGKSERPGKDVVYGPVKVEYETDEELLRSSFVTGENGVDYNILLESQVFKDHVGVYTWEHPNAYAAVPVRPAVLSHEGNMILPMNIFNFPIIADGEVVGVEYVNLSEGRVIPGTFDNRSNHRAFPTELLNSVYEKGDMVLFTFGEDIYAMWEDGTAYSVLYSSKPRYEGSLTFEELDQGYNRVSAEKFGEVFYSPSAEKGIEDAH